MNGPISQLMNKVMNQRIFLVCHQKISERTNTKWHEKVEGGMIHKNIISNY